MELFNINFEKAKLAGTKVIETEEESSKMNEKQRQQQLSQDTVTGYLLHQLTGSSQKV